MKATRSPYPAPSAPPMPGNYANVSSLPTVIAINTILPVSHYSHDKPIYKGW